LNFYDALRFVKDRGPDSLPGKLIEQSCQRVGYQWRERKLGPVLTIHIFFQQVLHGNVPIPDVLELTRQKLSESAYCQARARLPLFLYEDLELCVTGKLRREGEDDREATWYGHRVFFMDGSAFSMPDTDELRDYFGLHGLQTKGCGFPTARLLCLFDGLRGYLIRAIASPLRTHDLTHAAITHQEMRRGDTVVGDRNFGSYAHLVCCKKRGIHGVFRAHQARNVSFRPHRAYRRPGQKSPKGQAEKDLPSSRWIERLGKHDQLVEYFKPKACPAWMSKEEYAELPDSIIVRELRYRIRTPGRRSQVVTLVTTLVNAKRYSARAIAKLYGLRWGVETNLRHLKSTMHMNVLRCESVEGVLKELVMFALVYNLVRRVMLEASRRQQVAVERISFIACLRWLQHALPGERLKKIKVNPYRPDRYEPRKIKRRKKKYPHLKLPRAQWKKLVKRHRLAA
jgi:hypothetical protein